MRYIGPTEEVRQSFHQGTNRRAYEMLGAHPVEEAGVLKWHFSVWAPNAESVSVVGDFNSWNICGRDFVQEIIDSARKHGLKIGLYHSLNNWYEQPDAVAALENEKDYDTGNCGNCREMSLAGAGTDWGIAFYYLVKCQK